jgi:hypothetical protein
MSVVRFPLEVSPPVRILSVELQSVIDAAIDRGDLTAIEILGSLEWVKANFFYGLEDR